MQKYEGIWRKRLLVPCWVLQCIVSVIYLIIGGLAVAAAGYASRNNDDDIQKSVVVAVGVAGGVIIFFALLTIIFDIIECVFYAKRILNPVIALVFAVLKTLLWLIYFILSIAAIARGGGGALDIILSLVLVVTSIVQLGFSAKYVHMKRQGAFATGSYRRTDGGIEAASLNPGGVHYVGNAAARGGAPGYEDYRGAEAPSKSYYSQGVEMQAQYPAQPQQAGHY